MSRRSILSSLLGIALVALPSPLYAQDAETTSSPVADTSKDTIPASSVEDTTNDATTTPEAGKPPGFNDETRCGPRVRRPWSLLSNDDKKLFKDAVAMSMSSGLWADFIAIHLDMNNQLQAHESCGFLLWHRSFIMAMENHLRSLSDTFACVTIPTWDIFDEFEAQYNGNTCSDLSTCSPVINDICGLPVGEELIRAVPNSKIVVGGSLSNEAPCNAYCPLDIDGNPECGVLRNIANKPIPVNIGFAQLALLFKTADSYQSFSTQLIGPLHTSMHGALKGHMTTTASPADPLFFIWHATIDSLLYKFHQCKVGKAPLEVDTLASNKFAYASCLHGETTTDETAPDLQTPLSVLFNKSPKTKQVKEAIGASDAAALFTAVGDHYWNYVDARSLTSGYAYSYEFTKAFDKQFTKEIFKAEGCCPGYKADKEAEKAQEGSKTDSSDDDSTTTAPSDDDSEDEQAQGKYAQWTKNVQSQLENVYPNDTIAVAKYQAYLACIDFYSKNPDADYAAEFNKNVTGIGEDQCKEKAKEAITTGEVNINADPDAPIPDVASPAITVEKKVSPEEMVQQQKAITEEQQKAITEEQQKAITEEQEQTIADEKMC